MAAQIITTRRLLLGLLVLAGALLCAQPAQAQGSNLCVGSGPSAAPNGILEAGEECDDGNLVNEDGCNNFCGLGTCIDDLTGVTNNCTANDVNLGLLVVIEETDGCAFPGDTATVKLQAQLQATAAERYDIGMFIAQDGGDAHTGVCYHDYLPPPLFPAPTSCAATCSVSATACLKDADCPAGEICVGGYDPGSSDPGIGEGPFYNAECDEDPADLCGDLEQGVDTFYDMGFRDSVVFPPGSGAVELTVFCVDTDNDGFVDVGTCVSWDNAKSDGTSNKPSCVDIEGALPNTKAKCRCETLNIINLPVQRSIEVVKALVPPTDSGLFDLQIDGTTVSNGSCIVDGDPFSCCTGAGTGTCADADDVGDGGTTGEVDVEAGTHTVSEVAGTATDLGFYTTDIDCIDTVGRCVADPTIHCVADATCDLENPGDTCDLTPTEVASCTDCTSLDVPVPQEQTDIVCTITNTLNIFPPDLTVVKDNDADGDDVFNDTETVPASAIYPVTVPYQFTITNSSPSAATIDAITDDTHQAALEATMVCTREDGVTTFTYAALPYDEIGANETITCTFEVVFENADQASVTNSITATASNEAGTSTGTDDSTVLFEANPAIDIEKTTGGLNDANGNGYADAGETIDYTYTVTNTGNVTLTDVSVTDNMVAVIDCSPESNPIADMVPGEVVVCTGSYTLTQDDINSGQKCNVATATGTAPDGSQPSDQSEVCVELPPNPAIDIEKTTGGLNDANGNGYADAGETIDYTYTVTNTGNVTLTDVSVTDNMVAVIDCSPESNPIADMVPGEVVVCTGSYTLTQDDINSGQKCNVATATGTAPDGSQPSDQSEVCVELPPNPAIDIEKTTGGLNDANGNGYADAGETIDYTYTVTNTGNVTLTDVSVTDNMVAVIDCSPESNPIADMVPGEVVVCTGSYTLTQDDINSGQKCNVATATGTAPDGSQPSDQSEVCVELPPNPAIDIEKTTGGLNDANGNGYADAGETIDYTYTVTNTGNVTLTDVSVTDNMVAVIDCSPESNPIADMVPGEVVVCTGSYTLTQDDINSGQKCNVATATGTAPDGSQPSDQSEVCVELPPNPAIDIEKTTGGLNDANGNGYADAGETIDYTYTVTNTGNVTLTDVSVTDNMVAVIDCSPESNPIADMVPGEVVVCTGSYTLTQDDINSGQKCNVATATGTAPDGSQPSDQSEVCVELPPNPAIDIEKTTGGLNDANGNGYADAGETIDYTYTVTNTGNVTLTDVSVTDNMVAVIDCSPESNPIADMVPGEVVVCTGSYTLTQDDINSGQKCNVATATGTAPDGSQPSDQSEVCVELPPNPAIDIEKTTGGLNDANGNGYADAGETIDYTYTVTNTGNVTLTDVSVTDNMVAVIDCSPESNPIADMVPGEVVVCTGSYTLTQDDINSGQKCNVATATGTAPDGSQPSDQSEVCVELPPNPAIDIEKTTGGLNDANGNGYADAGETIDYTYTVTNTGNVTLTDVSVTDNMVAVIDCSPESNPIADMVPGEVVVCTGSYTLTQDDINSGQKCNVATATGTAPDGSQPSDQSEVCVELPPNPAIDIEKTTGGLNDANGNGYADAGETIDYTYTVTNTGNVTLTDVSVTDNMVAVIDCSPESNPIADMVPGEVVVCTGSYTLTQDDINSGQKCNVATATGTAPDGSQPSDQSEVCVELPPNPAIDIEKTTGGLNDANGNGYADAGETIDYTYTVTNTGNVTLTDVSVTDNMVAVIDCSPESNPIADMVPGEVVVCTGSYTLTQDDINSGQKCNVATATGTAPDGSQPSDQSEVCVELPPNPAIDIEKTTGGLNDANGNGYADAGETIDYTYTVTNTGNVTLTDVSVTDNMVAVIDCSPESNPIADMVPGEVVVCTGSYTLTQDDINSGQKCNVATATGTAPDGSQPSDQSEVCVELPPNPAIDIEKTTGGLNDANGNGYADAGETIDYTYTVTNTGNVTLTDVSVTDNMVAVIDCSPESNPIADMVPGEVVVCTGSYTLTQDDINSGQKCNVATATGTAPDGSQPSDQSEVCVELPPNPAIDIEKTTGGLNDANGNGYADAGETIDYTYTVTNTGNVTLTDVSVTDNMVAVIDCSPESNPIADMVPGEVVVCTGSYTLTQDDINSGQKCNVATATGTAPDGSQPSDQSEVCVELPPNPAIDIEKTTGGLNDANGNGYADAGETIDYTYTVTNTGNVTLTDVSVTDNMVAVIDCSPESNPIADMVPGEVVVCTGSYTLTQDDINSGQKCNVATATGTAPDGSQPSDQSEVCVELPPNPAIDIEKTTGGLNDANGNGYADAGETIDYTYTVTNTGNVTLTDVSVTDNMVAVIDCSPESNPIADMVPGEVVVCTGSYTLTQDDINSGQKCNVATATGTAPDGSQPSDQSEVCVELPPNPAIDIEKTTGGLNDANGNGYADAGETIDYTYTVTNTGNVTLTDVSVTDNMVAVIDCSPESNPIADMVPGEVVVCTGSYTLTQDDINSGQKCNVATATGTAPDGSQPSDQSEVCVELPPNPALTLDKTADVASYDAVGDVINYTYVVKNTGNITLTNVTLVDPLLGLMNLTCVPPQPSTLAPLETMTCTADYTITLADLDNGEVVNTATADSDQTDPVDDTVTVVADPFGQIPRIDILKATNGVDANSPPGPTILVNEPVTWTYVVTNIGTVTLTGILVSDDQVGPVSCPKTSLSPGDDMTCTASGTAQVGPYANIGTASGFGPHGPQGPQVIASDPSHYLGVTCDLTIDKGCFIVPEPESFDCETPVECLSMIWDGSISPNTGEACDVDKPTALKFLYTGDDCSEISNPQGGKAQCTDLVSPAPGGTVSLVMTKDADKISVFGNPISVGGEVTISRDDGNNFASDTKFNIVDFTGNVVQALTIHTSCSQPLDPGDQFGPVTLVEYTAEDGTVITLPPDSEAQITVRVRAWKGSVGSELLADTVVLPGQEFEVCDYSGSPNDVIWEIFEPGTLTKLGESEFHLSCSDDEMDGVEDCGTPQGNGKSNESDLINDWILEGLVTAGGTLDCTPSDPEPRALCEIEPPIETLCEQRPVSLSLIFNGGDCLQSEHTQDPSKVYCTGDADYGLVEIRAYNDSDIYRDFTDGPIAVGEVFTLYAATVGRSDLDSEMFFEIVDADSGAPLQEIEFHTSCSQDLRLGDRFGSLEVAGFTNKAQGSVQAGAEVVYLYEVTNSGAYEVFDVTVDDDKVTVTCPDVMTVGNNDDFLDPGESMTCEATAFIFEDTVNVATATAKTPSDQGPGATCESDPDSAEVVILSPPPCAIDGESNLGFGKKDIKWDLTNTGIQTATIESVVISWPMSNGDLKKVKFSGDTIFEGALAPTSATIGEWINSLDKRQFDPGETEELKIEFANNVTKLESEYSITVNFAEACSVTFDALAGADFECITPINCLTMEWGSEPITPARQNACDVGKPAALKFEYTGNDCTASNNDQGGKAICTDRNAPPTTGTVSLVMTSDANSITVTKDPEDGLLVHDWVTLSTNDFGPFPSTTNFDIIEDATGEIIQSLSIHTSCSQVLHVGDQFGSVKLVEATTEDGDVVSAPIDDTPVTEVRVKVWGGSVGSSSEPLAEFPLVTPGDLVDVCGFAGSPNDVTWEIFAADSSGAKLGESEFHLSCSDNAMDGVEDCDTLQGNGKSDDESLINNWKLKGIVSQGGTLDCDGTSQSNSDGDGTDIVL